MVQVGAYRENLDNSEENQLIKSFSPRTVDKNNYGDMNIYTIGNFTSYKEADALRKKLLEEGHKDVFVVAYEGKNKIHIADAIKKTKN